MSTFLFSNNASSTISGAISSTSTTVQLAAGTGVLFPQPTSGQLFVATFYDQPTKTQYEIVHVTAVVGDVMTIVRAQEGTTAKAWNAGDIFANLVTAGTLNQFVQAGTGPANTSLIYVGTDTSASPNLIVATTNPVPSGLVTGMQFNIKVANTNTGATNVQLNGGASIPLVRTDGSNLVGGNTTAGEEVVMVYNGSTFSSLVPPIPAAPPQTVFYVNPAGNDNNTGFANTSGAAFATIQGAINAISSRYISQGAITVRVADGLYTSGFSVSTNYIAQWVVIGNTAVPGNCVINATSSNPATYVPGAPYGRGVVASAMGNIVAEGFTFQSQYEQAAAVGGGNLQVVNCNFTAPIQGNAGPIAVHTGGFLFLQGTCNYTASVGCWALISADTGGSISLGYQDIYSSDPLTFSLSGSPSFATGTALANSCGVIEVYAASTVFTGAVPTAPQYYVNAGGGIIKSTFNFPGSAAGVLINPGWVL